MNQNIRMFSRRFCIEFFIHHHSVGIEVDSRKRVGIVSFVRPNFILHPNPLSLYKVKIVQHSLTHCEWVRVLKMRNAKNSFYMYIEQFFV